jgi:hypothetical protein
MRNLHNNKFEFLDLNYTARLSGERGKDRKTVLYFAQEYREAQQE